MKLIASEKINAGEVVSRVGYEFCRKSIESDSFPEHIWGFAGNDAKKGEEVEILKKLNFSK
jgi:hypothetical protein